MTPAAPRLRHLFPLLSFAATALAAEPTHRVAYDDAGTPGASPHLTEGEDWKFKNDGAPDEAARTVAFSNSAVRLEYTGMRPGAVYAAKLRFFGDSDRVVRVSAGGAVLADQVSIPAGKLVERIVTLPAAAYAAGALALMVEHVAGANAVVSDVEILSDDPAALGAPAVSEVEAPRLSPKPASVAGCAAPVLSLDGEWRFTEAAPADFAAVDAAAWKPVRVPGEWTMQGFTVADGKAAGYLRTFTLPADWAGKRVKLRCDGVYSDSVAYVNGVRIGRHVGGFTPFEFDITAHLRPGENTLAFAVTNESEADTLASGTKYACHKLGGIPRPVSLLALPPVNVAALRIATDFDAEYRDARLLVDLDLADDSGAAAPAFAGTRAVLSLTAPDGKPVALANPVADLSSGRAELALPVASPAKWDNEHPRLHTLTIRVERDGRELQTIVRRVGFRKVEVRGGDLLVNGRRIRLHGVNHHEVYPTSGRSVPAPMYRRDVELFREANVNLLRTCHYPPDSRLLEAADELGMFVEVEGPFCWAPGGGHRELVSRETAEMAIAHRNHASVLFWSLANESGWGRNFEASSRLLRKLDPTRPQTFNWMSSGMQFADAKYTDIANIHYPGFSGITQTKKHGERPVYHGEDTHVNAYNRLELATDPGLRDRWGKYIRDLFDAMWITPSHIGQSVWAGIDDTFYMPNGDVVGYGTWGPIDGWRRVKPEHHGMKRAYSPVRIENTDALRYENGRVTLRVQNRFAFSNLSEIPVKWSLGKFSGTVSADIAPGATGDLAIALPRKPAAGEKLRVEFADPRGFAADTFALAFAGDRPAADPAFSRATGAVSVSESGDRLTVNDSGVVWVLDKKDGSLVSAGKTPVRGPELMLLPLTSAGDTQMKGPAKVWAPSTAVCSARKPGKVAVTRPASGSAVVTIECEYAEAKGVCTLTFSRGVLEAAYDFTVTKAVNPRQIGLVFSLPHDRTKLDWTRVGDFGDVYPEDHIARLSGSVRADEGFPATSVGPRTQPSHPWRLDNLPYGNNDFCSTKHNFLTASLTDASGAGLLAEGLGVLHARAWRDDKSVNLLVADYSNGGSERFLRGLAGRDDRHLKPGDHVTGTVRVTPTR